MKMEVKFNSKVNKKDQITQCLPEKSTYFNENNDSLNLYDSFIESEDYINNSINKIFLTKSTLCDYEKIYNNEEEFNKIYTFQSNRLTDIKGANPFISQSSLENKVSPKIKTEKAMVNKVKAIIFTEIETQNKPKRTFENKKYKMGRKRKADTNLENNEHETNKSKNVHTKNAGDNLRIKFRRGFFKYLILFINTLIGNSKKLKKKGKIQKINLKEIIDMKKENVLKFLDLSAREFLSKDISVKCKTLKNDHNKNLIKYIYDIGEITITKVLDKSMRELLHIFCKDKNEDKENDDFKLFNRLQDFIDNDLKAKNKNNNDEDIEFFKYQALNFEEIIKSIDGRG